MGWRWLLVIQVVVAQTNALFFLFFSPLLPPLTCTLDPIKSDPMVSRDSSILSARLSTEF